MNSILRGGSNTRGNLDSNVVRLELASHKVVIGSDSKIGQRDIILGVGTITVVNSRLSGLLETVSYTPVL